MQVYAIYRDMLFFYATAFPIDAYHETNFLTSSLMTFLTSLLAEIFFSSINNFRKAVDGKTLMMPDRVCKLGG